MSYTPTSWTTGDTISASALNKIENGIADAGGGGEYDLVIEADTTDSNVSRLQVSNLTITEGSIADCVAMMENDRKIPRCAFRAIFGSAGDYFFTIDTDMSSFDIGYDSILFKGHNGGTKYSINIYYDDNDYTISELGVGSGW